MTKNKNNESNEIAGVLNGLRTSKEEKGIIPKSNKKIIVVNGQKEFKGKSLKINKGLYKDGQNYVYPASTKWEDIDNFGKKNIHFSESDFN